MPHGAIGVRIDNAVDGQQRQGSHDGNDDLDKRARELVPLEHDEAQVDDEPEAKQVVQLGAIGDGVDDVVDGQQRQGAHKPYDGDDDGAGELVPLDDIAEAKQVVPHGAVGVRLDDAVDGQQRQGAHDGDNDLDKRVRKLLPLDDVAETKQVVPDCIISVCIDNEIDGRRWSCVRECNNSDDNGAGELVPIDDEPIAWIDYSRNHRHKATYDYGSLATDYHIPDVIVQHTVIRRALDIDDD